MAMSLDLARRMPDATWERDAESLAGATRGTLAALGKHAMI